MIIIRRDLQAILKAYAAKFPVVVVVGPRQAGKTTLVQQTFPDHRYFSLEDPNTLDRVHRDPRSFLEQAYDGSGIIIDEFQNEPQILSYMQSLIDANRHRYGHFILTGSHNFLMNQAINQSLAGRIATLTLLPTSFHELLGSNLLSPNMNVAAFYGGYPDVVTKRLTPEEFYPNYNKTYVERDVRQLMHVGNLLTFQRFMRLCASRIGQLLNVSALANEAGISVATANNWLSILSASYILFFVAPHFNSFNKRLVKTPKLYFFDTGLACWLLKISSVEQLQDHYLRGGLIESMIVAELYKTFYNYGQEPSIYFWRDSHGHELDCLIDYGTTLIPVEIKGSKTVTAEAFDGIKYWCTLAKVDPSIGYLIYAGDETYKGILGTTLSWHQTGTIIRK